MEKAGESRLEYGKNTIFKRGTQHEATRNPASTASCNNALADKLKRERHGLWIGHSPANVVRYPYRFVIFLSNASYWVGVSILTGIAHESSY